MRVPAQKASTTDARIPPAMRRVVASIATAALLTLLPHTLTSVKLAEYNPKDGINYGAALNRSASMYMILGACVVRDVGLTATMTDVD